MSRRILSVFGIIAVCVLCGDGYAKDKEMEDEVLLSVDVGYNLAYRDKTWVPIDVVVHNEQADIEGMLEVRTYDAMNRLQSPRYRLPVNCPKDSMKRFRLMAYIDNADRVEAWIYERGRPAVDVPAYVKVRPIARDDLLAFILDDEPLNYQFLNIAIEGKDESIRFYRQPILTNALSTLPSHIKAYEPFDFIVIGEIDPGRVSPGHRQLIREYVEAGGVLIICTGLNGNRFRRTWVEELAGVEIGASENLSEEEIASRLFPADGMRGVREGNEIVFTELTTLDDSMRAYGLDRTLATRRSLGAGWVCTLAVDTKSHAFQDVGAYHDVWTQMMFSKESEIPLNYDLFSNAATQQIPYLSGISVRPLSFVLIYLLLYIGVGIIGNWLFWNRMKRREMAWVCLVIFSGGFSAYAYVSGTAGWAKSSQTQQIDIVHIKRNVPVADYYGLSGILTSRTQNYSAALSNPEFLMKDIGLVAQQDVYYGQKRIERTPFIHVQGDAPRLERFTVGASELRFAALEGKLSVEGGVDGEVVIDDKGIHGTFVNNTPIPTTSMALVYDGMVIPLQQNGEWWNLKQSHGQLAKIYEGGARNPNQFQYYNNYGNQNGQTFTRLQRALFTDSRDSLIPKSYPPMIVGWSEELVTDGLIPDREMADDLSKTLLVVEVPAVDERSNIRQNAFREDLLVKFKTTSYWLMRNVENRNHWREIYIDRGAETECEIRIPHLMAQDPDSVLEVTLYVEEQKSGTQPQFILTQGTDGSSDWHDNHVESVESVEIKSNAGSGGNTKAVMTKYRIENWRDYVYSYDDRLMNLDLFEYSEDGGTRSKNDLRMRYSVVGQGTGERQNTTRGEWPGWQ